MHTLHLESLMNILETLHDAFTQHLQNLFSITTEQCINTEFALNVDESKAAFGDINANAAMILAKQLKRNPRELAQTIATSFHHQFIEKIEVAGPGFLNLFLTKAALHELAHELYIQQARFFMLPLTTPKRNINIEFVSANPTGPLHLGHGRGGIIGDVLGNILTFLGHTVTKEFYINDAGSQIQKLGKSLKIRCQQESGMDVTLPEDSYLGDYLVSLAKQCLKEYGAAALIQQDIFFEEYAKEHLLAHIKATLQLYGITFDVWFSEKQLHTSGAIEATLALLGKNGYLFKNDEALWFKSTDFGDDKDRVVRKSSGELTYVAADSAYLKNKVDRGFQELIMTLGHDHHSYVVRLQALLKALGLQSRATLEVILYQLVKIKAGDQNVRMSKRAGTMVTLDDVIETVGTDVARFFYLNRKADAQLDFDLDLALKKTDENPVYYVQYAYVRINSILAKAHEHPELNDLSDKDLSSLDATETLLIKKLASLKPLLQTISVNYQTHLLTYYALELATLFHSYYSKHKILDLSNVAQSRARLVLITLLKNNFDTVLTLLGISRPEKM